ncbi:hypothetical protein [Roseimaritima sediminicola]|uniref:hypothetical protein n=1 Tax=Roseimaritima sediminicola TaxID=2662066 RepID=UPI0013870392|nr:hypothetical protein [Roseimaritima sediminicola]
MLPLSYLMCATLCVAVLATLGAERPLRAIVLVPLTLLVGGLAWQFQFAVAPLAGGGAAWGWFPLAAAWLLALLAPPAARRATVLAIGCCWLAVLVFSVAAAASPLVDRITLLGLATHRLTAIALAAIALAVLAQLCSGIPPANAASRWQFLERLSGALLLLLLIALTAVFFLQSHPLDLDPRVALAVMPAEVLAALCVYRGVHVVAVDAARQVRQPSEPSQPSKPSQPSEPSEPSQAGGGSAETKATDRLKTSDVIALLVLFGMAGGGLALVPVILSGARRVAQ